MVESPQAERTHQHIGFQEGRNLELDIRMQRPTFMSGYQDLHEMTAY
jgi:hypothetical protein